MAQSTRPTACIALADGSIFYGTGFGATGRTVAELVFNTAMTGYQEIMTDPSYAGQIVTFTFPHIGNTGVNVEDDETGEPVAAGMVVKWDPTEPSNWRSTADLQDWMLSKGRIGIGAQMIGIAQGAYEAALGYVKGREQFGKPIAHFQGVQFQLAEMRTELEAARLMVYNAARLKDAGQDFIEALALRTQGRE